MSATMASEKLIPPSWHPLTSRTGFDSILKKEQYHYPYSSIYPRHLIPLTTESNFLKKLRFYGILGTSLQWFSSYLMNRKQSLDCDGTFSTHTNLTTGAPQGYILGSLSFIICMNDIYEAREIFNVILYADDTCLFRSLCSFNVALNGTKFNKSALSESINTEFSNI